MTAASDMHPRIWCRLVLPVLPIRGQFLPITTSSVIVIPGVISTKRVGSHEVYTLIKRHINAEDIPGGKSDGYPAVTYFTLIETFGN